MPRAKQKVSDGPVAPQIRDRLLAGERLTANMIADDYGVSHSLLGTVARAMETRDGITVGSQVIEGNRKEYFVKGKRQESASEPEKRSSRSARLPALRTALTVTGHVVKMNDDGTPSDETELALSDGTRTWFVTLNGTA